MDALGARLRELFSWEHISRYLVDQLLPDVVVGALVFAFFYLLWKAIDRIAALAMRKSDLDATARAFIQTIIKYAILTIGVIATLGEVGIDTTGMLTSLGVAGLTIGFAARDTLSNVISGIFIFWDRPFVVGDLVEVGGQYGRVSEITMRSTRVVTVDGRMLAVPNASIVNSTVASYTNFPHLRLDVALTIGVEEDLPRVRGILLDVIAGDDRYLTEPAPVAVVTTVNDYNVVVELRAWISDERAHIPMRLELREKMFEALRAAGVVMPYETFELRPVVVRQSA